MAKEKKIETLEKAIPQKITPQMALQNFVAVCKCKSLVLCQEDHLILIESQRVLAEAISPKQEKT